MTLDKFLSTIAESQARIAAALEALVQSQGLVPAELLAVDPIPDDDDLDEEVEDDTGVDELDEEELEEEDDLEDDLDLDDDLEDEPPAKKKTKKVAAKKKAKKKTAKKSQVGKSDAPKSKYTADEVRGRLKDLQIATGSAAQAKSILKKNGASTFGQLVVGRYDQVVRECNKLLED